MKHHHPAGLVLLVSVITIALPVRAATPWVDRSRVPSGILYDLVTPVGHVDRFDGTLSAPPADAATLRQAIFELTRASFEVPAWPAPRALHDDGGRVVRIGLVDVHYDRIRADAEQSGAARVEGDRLVLDAGALESARAFMAAPVRGYTYRGADVSFELDPRMFVGSTGQRPADVEGDFGDGAGY
jgi:hypothetical protein